MLQTKPYNLPHETHAKLEALVDRVEAKPGDMIDLDEFRQLQERLSVREVIRTLPEGLTEEDFASILKLALLTECATETYGDAFALRARVFGAPWLGRFNERVWVPDELTHHTPYKYILMNMGFAEEELDREIRHVQEINYVHRGGDTPAHVSTFGVIQEYLTDNWHGLIGDLMRETSPEAAYMATRIKRRETLHTVWYRDMVALQIEGNPRLLPYVAEAIIGFEMPGNTLVPELQARVGRWLPLMGGDYEQIAKDLVRYLYTMLADTRQAGQMIMEIAAKKDLKIGPLSPAVVRGALDRLGGPGYGLVGEALLERFGLDYMFRAQHGRQDSGFRFYEGPYERVRGIVRTWIAGQIDFRMG